MMPTLVGQVPDDDLYTADDIDDETDLEDNNEFKIYKRAASADVVRGQMFDVIFQGKEGLECCTVQCTYLHK